ncbi:hypothetical protein CK203_051834 [Vitis vinifera]|uniref:Uncharacterized protein n=1 Tax=Vitis vinifera TaxID=29760 RepID=A0A438GUN7_VITVI|nr:hypothetical protein CK203_051834 [Vitis vinifera]
MSANKEATSSSSSGDAHAEKSVDKLSVKEFRERFCIPNGVFVELVDGEVVTTEKFEDNAIFFTKEQFNVGLQFPLSSLPSVPIVGDQPFGFDQGGRQGTCVGQGPMAGLAVHPDRPFTPNQSLKVPGQKGEAGGMGGESLVSTEPQPYVLNILPRRLPKEVVAGEHFILKDLPFYVAVQKADVWSRKARLNKREKKGKKEITIREPDIAVLPSVSSGSGRLAGLNHSGPSMPVVGRLALLAEEATLINQPGSPHPDADAAGAFCAKALPHTAPPTEETGAESQGLPLCEPSPLAFCTDEGASYKEDDHPEGSETEMAEENPTAPVLVPDGDSPGEAQGRPVDDAACISAGPFSYAELGEMLKQIPSGSDVVVPSTKMFEATEMRTNSEKELRLRLKQTEASLSAARDDNEALWIELAEAKSREGIYRCPPA